MSNYKLEQTFLMADSICFCCGKADGGTSAVWDSTEAVPPSFAVDTALVAASL